MDFSKPWWKKNNSRKGKNKKNWDTGSLNDN